MHLVAVLNMERRRRVALAAGHERRARGFASSLEQIARDGVVLGAAISEPGQDLTRPGTRATRTDAGWRIDGRKLFCTMSPAATDLYVSVSYADADGVERYAYAMVPTDAPGVVVHDDWDALGMRASGSNSVSLERVELPESGVRGGFRAGEPLPYMERNLVAGLFHAAASLGIAEQADELARRGIELLLEGVERTLARFRVHMDDFFHERSLHDSGAIDRVLERLGEFVYESEGALWLRTTSRGDDKDRVLLRSSGELTYFAVDIAHHADKLARGHERYVNVLGSDHHGYVKRIKAAWSELGGDPERYEIVIMQLVNLLERGEKVQMSKRAGAIVTLDDLVEDIGVDAARWYLLSRSHDTALDLDLALARSQSQDNPVYYVQYAHARIASILRKAGEDRVAAALGADLRASKERFHPSARSLVKRLLELPAEVADSAARRAPHRMTTYAHETAQEFSAFYRDCRVVGAAEEGGDEDVRIAICVVTRDVLAWTLDLVGVEAPESM
jgi:hypothetical protein